MTLLYVAAGCVLAALPGVYLPGTGWPLPVGVLCLALWLGLLLIDSNLGELKQKIYNKITAVAKDLTADRKSVV